MAFQVDDYSTYGSLPPATPVVQPGYFTEGNPTTGIPATKVTANFLNTMMLEINNVVQGAGLTLDKTNNAQMLQAVRALITSGSSGLQGVLGFTPVKQGGRPGMTANTISIGYTGANYKVALSIDNNDVSFGNIASETYANGTFVGSSAPAGSVAGFSYYYVTPGGVIIQGGNGVTATGYLDRLYFPIAYRTEISSFVISEASVGGWGAGTPNPTIYGWALSGGALNGVNVSACRNYGTSNVYQSGLVFSWMSFGS